MRRGKILVFSAVMSLSVNIAAYAQLSTNPWVTVNDEEDIAEVYEKRQRRGRGDNLQLYKSEDAVTIDRTHAYIQDEEPQQEDAGFLGRLKNAVSSTPKEEKPLIANTKDNRRKLAEQKRAAAENKAEEKDDSFLPSLGIGKNISALKGSMKLPSMNATGMIQKFEKASGINLKAIGRQMKGK